MQRIGPESKFIRRFEKKILVQMVSCRVYKITKHLKQFTMDCNPIRYFDNGTDMVVLRGLFSVSFPFNHGLFKQAI